MASGNEREQVVFVTKEALGVGRRGLLEIRDLERGFLKSHFAFTHTEQPR